MMNTMCMWISDAARGRRVHGRIHGKLNWNSIQCTNDNEENKVFTSIAILLTKSRKSAILTLTSRLIPPLVGNSPLLLIEAPDATVPVASFWIDVVFARQVCMIWPLGVILYIPCPHENPKNVRVICSSIQPLLLLSMSCSSTHVPTSALGVFAKFSEIPISEFWN